MEMTNRHRSAGVANIVRNLAWLLGGKGFGAVVSLAYLAILARALGIEGFGQFALIFGLAQAFVAFAGFQSWQIIVRFGTAPAMEGDWAAFGRLIGLTTALDALGIMSGSLLAGLLIWQFADDLRIPAHLNWLCTAFTAAMLIGRISTPSGIIRVLNRFDIGAYVEATVPLARLTGSLIIWASGPTVERFLLLWAMIEVAAVLLYWLCAGRLLPGPFRWAWLVEGRKALQEQQHIIGFTAVTYATSTLDGMVRQGPLLLVGAFFGTGAAGLYRLAEQLAQGIGKLALFASRAVFPDLTSIYLRDGPQAAMRLVVRLAMTFATLGTVFSCFAWLAGPQLILWMGGAAFAPAAPVLVTLVIAASIELAALAFEPLLFAANRARRALLVRCVAVMVMLIGLSWAAHSGLEEVAWIVVGAMIVQHLGLAHQVRTLAARS